LVITISEESSLNPVEGENAADTWQARQALLASTRGLDVQHSTPAPGTLFKTRSPEASPAAARKS
jgi:hypothetical protein